MRTQTRVYVIAYTMLSNMPCMILHFYPSMLPTRFVLLLCFVQSRRSAVSSLSKKHMKYSNPDPMDCSGAAIGCLALLLLLMAGIIIITKGV